MFCEHHTYDAELTIFVCDAWYGQRRNVEIEVVRNLTLENIVEVMLHSKANCEVIINFITTVLKSKEGRSGSFFKKKKKMKFAAAKRINQSVRL